MTRATCTHKNAHGKEARITVYLKEPFSAAAMVKVLPSKWLRMDEVKVEIGKKAWILKKEIE